MAHSFSVLEKSMAKLTQDLAQGLRSISTAADKERTQPRRGSAAEACVESDTDSEYGKE